MKRYRLGVVSYLNAKPLVYGLEQNPRPDIELVPDVPARLVERLRKGEIDAGLVSSIACLEEERLQIVARSGIACRGRVESICLFSKVEPSHIRRLALDQSSRTSVVLARLLLAECFGVRPQCLTTPPCLNTMLQEADAALLIGDPALRAYHAHNATGEHASLHVLDLGDVWHTLTHLPFVFAVWAARTDVDLGPLPQVLAEACEAGKAHLDAIADAAAVRLCLPKAACRNYLRHALVLDLGPQEFQGLCRFREMAIQHGLLPQDAPVPRWMPDAR